MSDFRTVLEACQRRGFTYDVFVDAGANDGTVASQLQTVCPQSRGYMLEPNPHLADKLQALVKHSRGRLKYLPCAVGSADCTATLRFNHGDGYRGGSLRVDEETRGDKFFDQSVEVLQRSLDSLLAAGEIEPPQLLKLDVEGAEVEALFGAVNTLKTVELICLETMLYRNWVKHPKFSEVINYLQQLNFVVYDFGQFGRRPYDGALMIVDLVMAREDSFLRKYQDWA